MPNYDYDLNDPNDRREFFEQLRQGAARAGEAIYNQAVTENKLEDKPRAERLAEQDKISEMLIRTGAGGSTITSDEQLAKAQEYIDSAPIRDDSGVTSAIVAAVVLILAAVVGALVVANLLEPGFGIGPL